MACTICSSQIEITGKLQIEATYTDPTGACCNGETCNITTDAACAFSWQGAGTTCAPFNDCKGQGACCIASVCSITNYDDCAGGTYLGDGTDCDPDPCADPTGECCRGGICTVTTEGNCSDGVWSVTGTCSPNPCPDTPRVLSFF